MGKICMSKRAFLIDGSALAYRSYFAFIRQPLLTSRGENISAAFGFANTLLRILQQENPDYLAVAFDSGKPTFRHQVYPLYKATRQKMPVEMKQQLPRIYQMLEVLKIKVLEIENYEADDVIGSLANQLASQGIDTFIVTGDKDFLQLVHEKLKIYDLKTGSKDNAIIDEKDVEKKYGIPPNKLVDLFALMGDKSDNIPGARGIGEKTALILMHQFGNLEKLLENIDKVRPERIKNIVQENVDQIKLSRQLVTINKDIALDIKAESLTVEPYDRQEIIQLFVELEFAKMLEQFISDEKSDEHRYHTITSLQELDLFIDTLKKQRGFVIDLETTSLNPIEANIVGISFSFREKEAFYLPSQLKGSDLSAEEILKRLEPILTNEKIKKWGQNIKYDLIVFARKGIELKGIEFDTMIASYLLNPSQRQHNLDALSLQYLNYKKIPTSDLIGKGRKQISMKEVPVEKIAAYACEDADITLRIKNVLEPRLKEAKITELFEEVEIPLINVLAEMEMNGVFLDKKLLNRMSQVLEAELAELEENIYTLAGEKFNINSPQQLGKILFEKLRIQDSKGVKKVKKSKTGYSTNIAVLESYSFHPFVQNILKYRQSSKLKSTYVDALPKLVNPHTGKVHTSFNQTVTATGRLSSSDPNLQNIPIRSELGRQIRKAFIPSEAGYKILSADYSQIELRIVAHLSGDKTLIDSFLRGEDIHQRTAALVFEVPPEEVTREMRSQAKSINFGIIYGMGPMRLASETGITMSEAKKFIESYFEKYPKVYEYIQSTIEKAKLQGYVTTILNRRRLLPEINSQDQRISSNAENIAINTPIQGSAADLIKVAMLRIAEEKKLKTKMILQVHDELVFEIPEDELQESKELIKRNMEGVYQMVVPIKADMGVGDNWLEAH
jgi:DNA polymerase-1